MGQSQSIAPQTLRTDAYTDEKVEEFRADPLITLRNAERRVNSDKIDELKRAWIAMTGVEDLEEGGMPMSHPGLALLLGYIFCAHNDTLRGSLLDKIVSGEQTVDELAESIENDDASNGKRTLAIAREIVKLFGNIFDRDGDGQLTWEEFVCGVVILTAGSVEEKSAAVFRAIDFDNDGSLTLTELQSFAETALRGAISTMRMSGSRLRISIGTQEIEASSDKDALKKKVWDEVARVIAEADVNRDWELSLAEYQSYVQRKIENGTASQSPFVPDVVLRETQ